MIGAVQAGAAAGARTGHSLDLLPAAESWMAAAQSHKHLFATLDAGARIGLIARETPTSMLVWEADGNGCSVDVVGFGGYSACGADVLMSADAEAMAQICDAGEVRLFDVLRACIRRGTVVCYMLRRRCDLEARGFDELLEALGFAFMGACR